MISLVRTSSTQPPSRRRSRQPSTTSLWLTAVTYAGWPFSSANPFKWQRSSAEHRHPTIGQQAANDRRIVVDAEAFCVIAHRVVEATRAVERHARAACDDLLHRDERSAGGEERRLVHAGKSWSVAVRVQTPAAIVPLRIGRATPVHLGRTQRYDTSLVV